jgi:intein-encoded DNA endonuclease-like protein
MNDLIKNINKIHTTALGIIRIKKNLKLETDDVVKWCKKRIKNADNIIKNGKNWYVYTGDSVITINSNSYTIITAH